MHLAASHELRLDNDGIPEADDHSIYWRRNKEGYTVMLRHLPDYLLKVLPSAPSRSGRLAAGGLQHLQVCHVLSPFDKIPDEQLSNVRTLHIAHPLGYTWHQFHEVFCPQRFPALRKLVLQLTGQQEKPLKLGSFQGLKHLMVLGSPQRDVLDDPDEIPALSSVPETTCVHVHLCLSNLLEAKHELQVKGYTHTLTFLWVELCPDMESNVTERIDLESLSVFTRLRVVYINISGAEAGTKTFIVQNFSYLHVSVQTIVCTGQTDDVLDLAGGNEAEIVMRCDLGWQYKVEKGRAWDRCISKHFVECKFKYMEGGEHSGICHIAERLP